MFEYASNLVNWLFEKVKFVKTKPVQNYKRISQSFSNQISCVQKFSKIIKTKIRMKYSVMSTLKASNPVCLAIKRSGAVVRTPAVSGTRVLSSIFVTLAAQNKSEEQVDATDSAKDESLRSDVNNNLVRNSIMRLSKKQLHLKAFLELMNRSLMQRFLGYDKCFLMTDNYLLAMSFVYTQKANLSYNQHCEAQVFQCLYIACQTVEDDYDLKEEVFPWLFGRSNCKAFRLQFLRSVRRILKAMDYRAIVAPEECRSVMGIMPNHPIWSRQRSPSHEFAFRDFKKKFFMRDLKGPDSKGPLFCFVCDIKESKKVNQDTLVVTPYTGMPASNFNGDDSGIICDTSSANIEATDTGNEFRDTILDFWSRAYLDLLYRDVLSWSKFYENC